MIKTSKIQVFNFEGAIRGLRNPMNSWGKSDSYFVSKEFCEDERSLLLAVTCGGTAPFIGKNDLALMKKLAKAGTEHRKYLRQIFVSMDITAPMYWWSEYDTYKVGTVANSTSKMHKLMSKPFEMSDFSFDKLPGYKKEVKQFVPTVDEEKEEWVKLDGYSVSDCGRFRNDSTGKILTGSKHRDGYIFVTVDGRQKPLHRYVALAFCDGRTNERNEVNHKDGNKMNNFASNLEWCSRSENEIHAYHNDLVPRSVNTYLGKFTEEQRNEIKKMAEDGISRREIAEQFGVSHTCINDVINDKYKYRKELNLFESLAKPLVIRLNELRDLYLETDDKDTKKEIWYSIIQLLPESYNQTRTVTMTYENVLAMIRQRENHKLDEWRTLVEIFKTLPYIEELCDAKSEQ